MMDAGTVVENRKRQQVFWPDTRARLRGLMPCDTYVVDVCAVAQFLILWVELTVCLDLVHDSSVRIAANDNAQRRIFHLGNLPHGLQLVDMISERTSPGSSPRGLTLAPFAGSPACVPCTFPIRSSALM